MRAVVCTLVPWGAGSTDVARIRFWLGVYAILRWRDQSAMASKPRI